MVLPKIKRARKANFSSLETSVLLEEYAAEKDLVLCSFSTEVTNKKSVLHGSGGDSESGECVWGSLQNS